MHDTHIALPVSHTLMISRVWRGWTVPENADAYQHLLQTTILPGIGARKITGYLSARLDRRDTSDKSEFVTTMLFDSLDAVIAFAGAAYETAVVPPAARQLLATFDAVAAHYRVIQEFGGS